MQYPIGNDDDPVLTGSHPAKRKRCRSDPPRDYLPNPATRCDTEPPAHCVVRRLGRALVEQEDHPCVWASRRSIEAHRAFSGCKTRADSSLRKAPLGWWAPGACSKRYNRSRRDNTARKAQPSIRLPTPGGRFCCPDNDRSAGFPVLLVMTRVKLRPG